MSVLEGSEEVPVRPSATRGLRTDGLGPIPRDRGPWRRSWGRLAGIWMDGAPSRPKNGGCQFLTKLICLLEPHAYLRVRLSMVDYYPPWLFFDWKIPAFLIRVDISNHIFGILRIRRKYPRLFCISRMILRKTSNIHPMISIHAIIHVSLDISWIIVRFSEFEC